MTYQEIRSDVVLEAHREPIILQTQDNLRLVGELALPRSKAPVATMIALHPLPTAGGFMDSHLFRKSANRLPALADIAVLRFNTRGTSSPAGTSQGVFSHAQDERYDVEAAIAFAQEKNLPNPWVVGWSFGTDLALMYAQIPIVQGLILLSPPLRFSQQHHLAAWAQDARKMIVLVPEYDNFLQPEEAQKRFSVIPQAEVKGVAGAKHLWVGEKYTRIVLEEIVSHLNPACPLPLPVSYLP